MATNFFSRWSQRKLDQSNDEILEPAIADEPLSSDKASSTDESVSIDKTRAIDTETTVETSEPVESSEKAHVVDPQDTVSETTEDLSVAQLLVSEASESVKKAALRKLFLSEEFNIRDGLDDYDDDYSNLKSLSEGVAETLRDWVKDKTEEETTPEEEQVIDNGNGNKDLEASKDEIEADDSDFIVPEGELDVSESAEITEVEKELYKNTVSNAEVSTPTGDVLKEVGQNIPHKK